MSPDLHLPGFIFKQERSSRFLERAVILQVHKSFNEKIAHREIQIISPVLIFVQKAFLLGLFSVELIFGWAYYWKEVCVSKWVGLDNKNSLKH